MATINLLSSKIYNRIAAGEVVERPSSVVKELVENSLDAKATSIDIEIEDGGTTLIKITDNGSGIEKSELKKALLPHATSKISSLKDLDAICSLGFRGEALASIASVSKIEICSKPENQVSGASISADGGEIHEIVDNAIPFGTQISVKNLFYNTPVRAKFLKTPRSEESEITSLVARFILGHSNVAFKYIVDGKTVLQSFGDGFESAFVNVYGVEVINNCFYIETTKNGITIKGYIGKHNFSKANRSYQTVFLNGRFVVNQTIASAISNAYSAYLMKRQYPFYSLIISVPNDIVDVNVHPNKIDVRFANNQIIYGSIYSVISKVLDGSGEALDIVSAPHETKPLETVKIEKQQKNNVVFKTNYATHNAENSTVKGFGKITFSDNAFGIFDKENDLESHSKKSESQSATVDIFAENKAYIEKLERERAQRNAQINVTQEEIRHDRTLNLIGQALNTFLVLDDGQDLYLVDQHAAHERIIFDKLNESIKNKNVETQPLLLPYVLNVSAEESEFLNQKLNVLIEMGVEIAEFGRNSFKISAIPLILSQISLKKFFDELLSDVNGLKNITVNDVLMDKIAQKACKSAVKSGDKLSDSEIEYLLKALQGNLGMKCPHGRPVTIKITRTEIDKWFKRIV